MFTRFMLFLFFFFNDTATTEIYTLSLHDALPIFARLFKGGEYEALTVLALKEVVDQLEGAADAFEHIANAVRSEEHTSELQSRQYLVCRLLLEKKKKETNIILKDMK